VEECAAPGERHNARLLSDLHIALLRGIHPRKALVGPCRLNRSNPR
jgi:hypothetical protein